MMTGGLLMNIRKRSEILTLIAVTALLQTSYVLANEDNSNHYHMGIGIAQPSSFGNDYNHYNKLFGGPSTYPEFFVDYRLISLGDHFDFGFLFKIGFYRDSGKSVQYSDSIDLSNGQLERDLSDNEVDQTQKSVLTIIPTQMALSTSYRPLSSDSILISAWMGLGYSYIENTTIARVSSSLTDGEITPYLNSGFNTELVQGVSVALDVSWIDPRSSYTLRVYGVENIYFTPFFQNVKTLNNTVGTYDRQVIGMMFSFDMKAK